ncbi:hypothetical protein [Labrys sp. (in: a-proteobacteria)]|uniref:hypothetical protein n=1 Tax=Labrys sp. (in: a-proteobacteria) TaxID=1917972 RepID=UPI0039E63AD8
MAIPTPENARFEVRLSQMGRMRVYFDGKMLPCVTNIKLEGEGRDPASVTIVLYGGGVRLVTEEPEVATIDRLIAEGQI